MLGSPTNRYREIHVAGRDTITARGTLCGRASYLVLPPMALMYARTRIESTAPLTMASWVKRSDINVQDLSNGMLQGWTFPVKAIPTRH